MMATVPDMAPCGYFSFSDDGIIIQINSTACSWLKTTQAEVNGKSVETIFTIPTKIFFHTHLFPLVKMHGHAEEIYVGLKSFDGNEVPVLLNAKRTGISGGNITECAFIVVHNRKKFEEELIAARKVAEAALRENTELMKAKAELQHHSRILEEQMQLVARHNHEMLQLNHAVTHNLKEPLRKVLMFAGKIGSQNPSPDLERLMRSTEQLKGIVSALQEYVWLDEKVKTFSPHPLAELIQFAADKVGDEFSVALDLKTEHLPVITGDAEQLRLLFYHLLANAAKFRKGDKVTVKVRGTQLKKNSFRKLAGKYSYEEFVKLEIEDKGIGFDPVYKEAVFELFRKLHFGNGQGVGLALAKKIVQNHGGYIEAEAQIDQFTRIIIYLPLMQGDEVDAQRLRESVRS